MKILTLNCGGSSMKYQLFRMDDEAVLAKGSVDRMGTPESVFRHSGLSKVEFGKPIFDFTSAIAITLEHLADDGLVLGPQDLAMVVHKLAHGGSRFTGAVLIDDRVLEEMRRLSTLAPVHNPPAIAGIEQCRKLFPGLPQAGVFETTFHHTVPDYAYTYALPLEWRDRLGVRKYGFHGASHGYVSTRLAQLTGQCNLRVVSCHLGSGTSVAAIRGTSSIDISSGMTPQSGTPMSTRPGDFDPWVFPFVMDALGMTKEEANAVMVKNGGLLGISGVSGDMRDIEAAEAEGNDRARLAIDVFCYQIKKYIGAFAAALDGVDAIVFTGGIGEKSALVRRRVCSGLSYLGVEVDDGLNDQNADEFLVSTPTSRVAVHVIATNEELMVARQAAGLIKGRSN